MKRKSTGIIAVLITIASVSYAFDQSHTLWDQALQKYNHHGLVNYQALKSHPEDLNNYLKTLAGVSEAEYSSWKQEEKSAFWINAYNASTWKAIIDHYPIKASFLKSALYPKNSIRQIEGVWDKITFPVMGKQLTLGHIEHQILRKEFNEPRIHMALVCAALGCPPLREEAFTGGKLASQLDDQARQFFANPEKFQIDRKDSVVYISSIFDWFGEDFIKRYKPPAGFDGKNEKEKAVLTFASQYLNPSDREYLASKSYTIKFLKYDWTLNEEKK